MKDVDKVNPAFSPALWDFARALRKGSPWSGTDEWAQLEQWRKDAWLKFACHALKCLDDMSVGEARRLIREYNLEALK